MSSRNLVIWCDLRIWICSLQTYRALSASPMLHWGSSLSDSKVRPQSLHHIFVVLFSLASPGSITIGFQPCGTAQVPKYGKVGARTRSQNEQHADAIWCLDLVASKLDSSATFSNFLEFRPQPGFRQKKHRQPRGEASKTKRPLRKDVTKFLPALILIGSNACLTHHSPPKSS